MKTLCVIPSRGGSKGIPHKNIKLLHNKPLIGYAIESARELFNDEDICVSTDDLEIIKVVEEQFNLKVPFVRPEYLATDNCGTYEVLLHAVKYYKSLGRDYDVLVLLQPTSPFRDSSHIKGAIDLYTSDIDMVVSVKESNVNPYYNLFEEDNHGYLCISKGDGNVIRRQDAPTVYEYNGAVYVINIKSLKEKPLYKFEKRIKYIMDEESSLDLDSLYDWNLAEMIIANRL